MSPDDSDQLTRSLRSDCKALQSVMGSMLLKNLVSSTVIYGDRIPEPKIQVNHLTRCAT